MKSKKILSSPLRITIFLLFYIILLSTTVYIISEFIFFLKTTTWKKTPCQIEAFEYSNVSDKTNKTKNNQLEIHYTYNFKGNTYSNNKIFAFKFNKNKKKHSDYVSRKIKSCQKKDKCYCYVNPKVPSQAVLNKYMNSKWFLAVFILLVLSLKFTFTFLGIIYSKIFKKNNDENTEENSNPQNSIMNDKKFQNIKDESLILKNNHNSTLWFFLTFTIFWNIISWSSLLAFLNENKLKFGPELFILLFPIVGFALIILTLYLFLQQKKFGKATFIMKPFPSTIGGKLTGNIYPNHPITSYTSLNKNDEKALVQIKCIQRIKGGRSNIENTIYEDEQYINYDLINKKFQINFTIPETSDGEILTSYTSNQNNINWILSINLKQKGINFNGDFIFPVIFDDNQSDIKADNNDKKISTDLTSSKSYTVANKQTTQNINKTIIKNNKNANLIKPQKYQELLKNNEIIRHQNYLNSPDLCFELPRTRKIISKIFSLILSIAIFSLGYYLTHHKSQHLFGTIITIFSLLILLSFLYSIFLNLKIFISKDHIIIIRDFMFFIYNIKLKKSEILSIKPISNFQQNNKNLYTIKIETKLRTKKIYLNLNSLSLTKKIISELES